ncbi:MAG: GNAT family N-acetyltransferase [Candidatus Kerfeldbacteria bacterium]|nr:GNAT family N-acetyltransferase [Candidatus Kerfeldbacteria bacterium]
MTGIIIRPARRADLPSLYRLARNPKLAAPSHQAAERWWIRSFLDERQILIVAVHDDQVVGFVMGETGTGKVAIGHLLVVQRSYQKRGLAQRLGRAFERECRNRGMTCVLLYASSRPMEQLLTKAGYVQGSPVREYQKFL